MKRRLCQWGAVLSLGVLFALALSSAAVKSPTMDEGGKLAMGYSYLATFNLRFQKLHKHPRLAEAWFAFPLIIDPRVPTPSDVPGWDDPRNYFEFVSNFLYRNPDIVRYTLVGRVQAVLLGVLLGALVFRWASEWFGWWAGLSACFLYAFSPNVIAHSRLITNDLPAALACLATMYVLQRMLRRPGVLRAGLTGLVLGCALLVKYSAVLLVPAVGGLLFLGAWCRNWCWTMWPDLGRRRAMVRALGMTSLIFFLAGLVVWAGFAFEVRSLKVIKLPLPVPAASCVDDIVRLYRFSKGRPGFLLGHRWVGSRWYYFLATSLFKTPVPSLLLFLAAAVLVGVKRRLAAQLPLWLFPALYFLVNVASGRNTGHRYLLPALVFGFVFVSQIVPVAFEHLRMRWARVCSILLMVWYLGISLWIYPDYLAYFNLFAGGPSRGYKVLVESNLDWGQDIVQLRRYMEDNGLDEIWLSLFCLTDPSLYGIRYRRLPDWEIKEIRPDFHYLNPDPGVYVISATLLQGLYLPNPSTFDWFLHREPIDQIGYSMLVYEVGEDASPPAWLGMCYAPAPPLSPDEVVAGFGRTDLRVVYFDCRSSWVIPAGGAPGWYIVPALPEGAGEVAREWLRGATLEFEQRSGEGGQDFTVHSVRDAPQVLSDANSPVYVLPGNARVDQEIDRATPVSPPLELEGPAAFRGYRLDMGTVRPGNTLTLQTIWEARRVVTDAMPSVFVHLVDVAGDTWAVGDALDFSSVQWQDGDVIVQQHTLELPPDIPPGTYWIAAGLYDLVTGARYPLRAAVSDADAIWFGPVAVERGG